MRYLITLTAAFLASAACLAQDVKPAPHCNSSRECEIMWADAQEAVGLVSNMRIRLLTDTRIETYPPNTYGRVGAVVTKTPAGTEGYDVKIRLECYVRSGCEGIQASGTKLFNSLVAKAPAQP